jgi:C4-dicarboxylate-specific signal transduction histidine kinase
MALSLIRGMLNALDNRLNEQLEKRVKERTFELEEMNAELHKMNRLFVGRELRMVELKEKMERKCAGY